MHFRLRSFTKIYSRLPAYWSALFPILCALSSCRDLTMAAQQAVSRVAVSAFAQRAAILNIAPVQVLVISARI